MASKSRVQNLGSGLISRGDFTIRHLRSGVRTLWGQNRTRIPLIFLSIVVLTAIFGPYVTPYTYNDRMTAEDGSIEIAEQPSLDHPLGTTSQGYDVLSRILWGARPTALAGLLGGIMIIGIGLTVALLSGYYGGSVDNLLMRVTDFFFAIPVIPFAVVVLAFLGSGFYTAVFIIGILLWRGNARVIRAQILQIKERPYILSARATGASSSRIILKHILPNVAPMAVVFFALGVGYAIIAQAGLAFIGVASPFRPSWGVMIRNAYNSGYMSELWAWSLTPGILIALVVLSCFLLGRGLEGGESRGEAV